MAAEGVGQKRWLQKKWARKGGCRRSGAENGAEKVVAAEIVGKANPRNRGGFLKRERRRKKEKKRRRSLQEGQRGRELEFERTSGKEAFLGWLLKWKESCPISCPPSLRELF